jgi:hypothetical protein
VWTPNVHSNWFSTGRNWRGMTDPTKAVWKRFHFASVNGLVLSNRFPGPNHFYVWIQLKSGYFPFNWKCTGRKDLVKSNIVWLHCTLLTKTMGKLDPSQQYQHF